VEGGGREGRCCDSRARRLRVLYTWCIHWQAVLEKLGVATVSVVIDYFKEDALAGGDEEGMNLRSAYASFPMDQTGEDAIEKAKPMMPEIIDGLTKPLTEFEKSPQPKGPRKLPRMVSRAYRRSKPVLLQPALDGRAAYYASYGRSGEGNVERHSHPAEEVIGIMPPESWKATVEGWRSTE